MYRGYIGVILGIYWGNIGVILGLFCRILPTQIGSEGIPGSQSNMSYVSLRRTPRPVVVTIRDNGD